MRAFVATRSDATINAGGSRRAIREKLLAELMNQHWFNAKQWFKIWAADIIVRDGVVHFWFSADHSAEERRAACIAAENTRGVRRSEEHIVPSL